MTSLELTYIGPGSAGSIMGRIHDATYSDGAWLIMSARTPDNDISYFETRTGYNAPVNLWPIHGARVVIDNDANGYSEIQAIVWNTITT